jgi:hypothetical protein
LMAGQGIAETIWLKIPVCAFGKHSKRSKARCIEPN